jgi:glycosyltransferase involved in cell wall biosynthesis
MDCSVVLPVYNERDSLRGVYEGIQEVLTAQFDTWEILFVDDGSTDGSRTVLSELHEEDTHVRVIKFAANFGQSAALDAGLRYARGDLVITMDADGQNDPADIPRLVEALESNAYDCVVGWRRERNDPLGKRLASAVAAKLRRFLLSTELHDYGCTLKVFRREAAQSMTLNGEMHRYIPPLLSWRGFDVGEIEVNHRERQYGETKYSWQRLPKGFLDLLNVWFWQKYSARPLHIFGGLGIVSGMVGVAGGMLSIYLKVFEGTSLSDTALPLFAVFMCLLGIQFFISGILADISIKNYFSNRQYDGYRVADVLDDSQSVEFESSNEFDSRVTSKND